MMGMLLLSMLSEYSQWCACPLVKSVLSPHSDGDATLVNAVFEYSWWCACPLVNVVLSPHSDGDATLINTVFSPHSGVHSPLSILS